MKYRVLTPEEMEAYKIGYKVGARELFITGQEWESEEEHSIYRKGYLAGCKDRERKNLKPELLDKCQQCQQCQQCQNHDSVTVTDTVIDRNSNKGGVGGKEKGGFVPPKDADEVYEYAQVSGIMCSKEQAQDFYDYYSGIGWRISNEHRTPINDWRPFWRKWLRNPIKQPQRNEFGQPVFKMSDKPMTYEEMIAQTKE